MLRRIYIYSFLASALMLVSCNRDNGIGEPHLLGEDISFSPTIVKADWSAVRSNNPNPPSTKGSVDNDLSSIGVMAFMSTSPFAGVVSSIQPNLMYNQKLTKDASNAWSTSTTFYWPVGGNMSSFFAYSPYAEVATNGISVSAETASGIPKVTYSMPLRALDQPDLLIATSHRDKEPVATPLPVALSFKHALAAISFSFQGVGNDTISKVGISGIINQGTIEMDDTGALDSPKWQDLSSRTATLYKVGLVGGTGIVIVPGKEKVNLTDTNGHIMVIPQDQTAETKVKFAIGDKVYVVPLPGSGKWKKGLKYRYNIVVSLVEITVTLTVSGWEDTINLTDDHLTELVTFVGTVGINEWEEIIELTDDLTELAKILGTTTTDGWGGSVDNPEDLIQ